MEAEATTRPTDAELRRACPICQGIGWKDVEINGVHRRVPCDHGRPANAPAGGFAAVGEILADPKLLKTLDAVDQEIAALIDPHRGAANPVAIEEIGRALWPREWAEHRSNIERGVKASVSRLRMIARIPIASSKVKPFGFFIPSTDQEAADYAERMLGEAIRLIEIARVFRPQADWLQMLRGQLELRAESAEGAEVTK